MHLPFKNCFSLGSRFLARGERSIARAGILTAAVLLAVVSACAWWAFDVEKDSAADAQINYVRSLGIVLSRSAQTILASNELTSLRRLTIDSARDFHLDRCRIVLQPNQVVADANPAKINQLQLPEKWSSGPLDGDNSNRLPASDDLVQFQFPISVEGRGTAFLEIAAMRATSRSMLGNAQRGIVMIGTAGLCVLLLAYRRLRTNLAAIDAIEESLRAYQGQSDQNASLAVDARLGFTAEKWNKLLTDMEDLRRQNAMARASASGGRRVNSGGLESACDSMSQGLLLVDERMKVRFANGAAGVFLNAKRESLIGSSVEEMLTEDKLKLAVRAIACEQSRRPVTIELERQSDTGGGVLRFSVRPVRKGDPEAATIIIEDVTQQRTAERARNSFISQVTHELRTPLTNIRLYAETAIEQRDSDPAMFSTCLNVINQESRRLERIVGEMLSVAEMEAGSTTIRKDDVHVDVLFNELRNDYKAQADEKKIQIEFVLPPKLPVIQADRDKLAIALHNLLGNALKYTSEGGKVTISADCRDGKITFDVADSGIGIAPDELDSIFDKFTRSKDPRVTRIVGTGLGLTLAREVMRLHGGDITVQSELNRGSTFTASLPVNLEAA